ncbi:hypothetical protein NPX13_g10141 [Xylaria arbuscula]|uniref:Uncharacterized protein n=1 Tax=Xylaria arbuscula TaxID=114810 RepID=A0A9W8N5D7_9PEZI|nr:hypothetical protein NPX13_g10141 [Xylaria arbuscula]
MAWWITMLVSGTITVAGGTYGCRWRELRPITFGGRGTSQNENRLEEGGGNDDHGDEEMGFSRGRGRGRGRDGAGEYELTGIKGDANK